MRRIETLVHTCDQLFSRESGFPSCVEEICGVRYRPQFDVEAWKRNAEALVVREKETV